MRKTKLALFHSVIALILCFSMLIGTTFAWFTDVVRSGVNQIVAGNLDVELEYLDKSGNWRPVREDTNVFAEDTLWEPGHTEVVYLRISNQGDLALKYQLGVNIVSETPSIDVNNQPFKLSEHIRYGLEADRDGKTSPWADREKAVAAVASAAKPLSTGYTDSGALNAGGEKYMAMVVYMPETVGNEANYKTGQTPPEILLGIRLVATQQTKEQDSFGDDYDDGLDFPELKPGSISVDVKTESSKVTEQAVMTGEGIGATVPVGVQVNSGVSKLTLSVSVKPSSEANLTLGKNELLQPLEVHVDGVAANNTQPIIITIEKAMMTGLNMGNYTLYHVENGVTKEMTLVDTPVNHNEFSYNPATGDVTLAMATFSEVALVADTVAAWNGQYATGFNGGTGIEEDPYIIANADQLAYFSAAVGGMVNSTSEKNDFEGKYIKLVNNIDLGDKDDASNNLFYPIGYYNDAKSYTKPTDGTKTVANVSSFSGTFDGNGHTIANFYQNTWQMWGNYDGNHYKAAMGLFGYVNGGTVKNLTVDNFSSDGEFTPTGVIAAYAVNSTFENIAITNCNPRVYNTGNGGIVGIGGNSDDPDTYKLTFTNITIDNTNKISALWGSWDVACGGLVGMFRGAGHVYMTNCHVGAQIDVYNDVCGNYQYYWYRYSGMMIGTNKNMITDNAGYTVPETDKFHAENCTVHFGEWNDYYYCELVANSLASYTHDHQFSRLTEISSLDEIKSGDTWTKTGNFLLISGDTKTCYHIVNKNGTLTQHLHTDAGYEDSIDEDGDGNVDLKEDKQIVYLPFNQLFTGYGWGVKHIPVYNGEDYAFDGITILDRTTADSVEKFEGKATELANNKEYKLGDIFTYLENCGVKLVPDALTVTVTNLDENGIVTAEFVRNTNNWAESTIAFTNTGRISITIQDYYFCTPTTITVDVKNAENITKINRFTIEFPNTAKYLYRVGNLNAVPLNKLFGIVEGEEDNVGSISVNVETIIGASAPDATNVDLESGTIQFTNTGVVAVTISDDNFSVPKTLYLEVVDAYNATSAVSAPYTYNDKAYDVVLLNNTSSGGFTVKDGYAFYGNGFTVTCSGKGTYLNHGGMTLGYVTVQTGGILDNVQVICDVYPKAFIYTEEVKVSSNLDTEASTSDKSRYMYQLSAISVSGDGSVVANCYAYGGRNNIFVGGGDVTIENTVTECGTLANIQIKGSSDDTVTIKDTTTIQYRTTSKYDSTKVMLGFGIVVGDNESTSNANIILQGDLKQYNWVTSDDTSVSNTYAQMAIKAALDVQNYQHTIDGKVAVNMGIAYLNTCTTTFPSENDQRTNKQDIPYAMNSITMQGETGYVYSIAGSAIDGTSRYNAEADGVTPYVPNAQRDIPPKPVFSLGSQTVDGEDRYLQGDINGITARYENGQEAFTLDITQLMTASKYGSACVVNAICIDLDGNTLSGTVTLNKAGTYTLKFTIVDTVFYSYTGEQVAKTMEYSHTVPITLTIAEPSVPDATLTVDTSKTYTGEYTDSTTDGSKKLSFNPLEAITVTDAGETFTLTSNVKSVDITYAATGTDGNGNAFGGTTTITVTYNEGQVLKIVLAKPTSNSPGNPKSITYDSSTGTVKSSNTLARKSCTAATWAVSSYSFTGKNGKTVTGAGVTFSIDADTSGGGCVTADTLVTLADGTQKRIDEVTFADQLLVWDFDKGEYTVTGSSIIENHGYDMNNVIKLTFEDGTAIKVVNVHGFFDADLNKWVDITAENAQDFVGHRFTQFDGDSYKTVKLVSATVTTEYVEAWAILTADHYNCILEGMFSITPPATEQLAFFEIGEDMKYDADAKQADIEKYGLYTYEEFAHLLTYEQFDALNVAEIKVAVGKGLITYDEVLWLIDTYIN